MRGMFGVCGSWQDSDFILSLSILKPLILPAKDSELSSHAIEFANPGVRQGCSLDGQLRPGSDEARAGGWTGSVLKVLQKAAGHGKPLG